jgi:anti-sigma factor RsiW
VLEACFSTDRRTLKPWFDGKLDFIPPMSNFSQQGFPLVGGRVDMLNSHHVAALGYPPPQTLHSWLCREKKTNLAGSGSHQVITG